MKDVLIIEDDKDLSYIMSMYLKNANFKSDCVYTFEECRKVLCQNKYRLILLDLILPDLSGEVLCKKIRELTSVPLIIVSCLGDKKTIVAALKNGADDYVVKPINYEEVIARIEANLRRSSLEKRKKQNAVLNFNQFYIDTMLHKVYWKGNENKLPIAIDLSPTEYSLLILFVENPNILLPYKEMYQHIWDTDSLDDVRTVMVHVSNLRKKIDLNKSGIIQTVRGAGYLFSDI